MKSLLLAILVAFSCVRASGATVSLTVFAGILRDSAGNPLSSASPVGRVVLVAGTSGGVFGGPTAGSFISGADVLLSNHHWNSVAEPGFYNQTIPVDESLVGRAVMLFWYPTLDDNDLPVSGVTTYGAYRDLVANGGSGTGTDGSDPWYVPPTGLSRDISFLTISASGSNPNEAGFAFALVPEASNFIFGGLALGLVAFRIVPQIRRKLLKV